MEAVRLLQVEIQSIIKKELRKAEMQNHRVENEKILSEQKVEQLQKLHDKEVIVIKDIYDEDIKRLKAIITEEEERKNEECKERIKEIKEADKGKIVIGQITKDIETLKTEIGSSKSLIEGQERALQKLTLLASTWREGSYCILANGDCPPGFSRSEGYTHAVKVWSCTGSTSPATFGDSYFRHHRQCNHGNYADITIVACCK